MENALTGPTSPMPSSSETQETAPSINARSAPSSDLSLSVRAVKESRPFVPFNWHDLEAIAVEVFTAFQSLRAETIGGGLLYFDKASYKFFPRSNYFDVHLLQSIASVFEKRATFEHTHAAFYEIHGRTRYIRETMEACQPATATEIDRAKNFLFLLTRIQTVIDEVTTFGIDTLCQNYTNLSKFKQAASLRALGSDAIKHIAKARKALEGKLTPSIPNLHIDLALKRYLLQVEPILKDRENNIQHLRAVRWNRDHGVTLPIELLLDCLREREFPCTKAALKNAACLLKIPMQAREIPTLGGTTVWRPMRLSSGSDEVSVFQEEGVTGTCERDGLKSDNLCNLYYEVDASRKVKISCGAINTSRKAAQLAYAMSVILGPLPPNNGRWVVHQLNSFFKEEDLIQGVHANIALNEAFFQQVLGQPNLSFLHFNTCFNAATIVKNEDPQSVMKINIDALGRLAEFLNADLKTLLSPQLFTFPEPLNLLLLQLEAANRVAVKLSNIKKQLQKLDGKGQFDKLAQTIKIAKEARERELLKSAEAKRENAAPPPPSDEEALPLRSHSSPGDAMTLPMPAAAIPTAKPSAAASIVIEDEEDPPNLDASSPPSVATSSPALTLEHPLSVPAALPLDAEPLVAAAPVNDDFIFLAGGFAAESIQDIKELKLHLDKSQNDLIKQLSELATSIALCIQALEQSRPATYTPYYHTFEKAVLILTIYHQLLKLQLRLEKTTLTRSTEIELFLLLYVLLDIKPIIVCYSGLDRSGQVRAMSGAMTQLMEGFYHERLAKTADKNAQDQATCRIEAAKKMLQLIVTMDGNRLELLNLMNQLSPQPDFVMELSQWEKSASDQDARAALFAAIDQKYPPASGTKAEELKCSQFYLELIVTQLLKTEAEKTFYSCGGIGLKYHHGSSGPKKYFANQHVLDRWTPIVFVQEGIKRRAIKTINYSPGWFWTAHETTAAANVLLQRLSKYRGT